MSISQSEALREQLLHSMRGDQSHIEFESVIGDFPVKLAGRKPGGVPHSAWQLLEHMRLAQNDILEFSRKPKYVSPDWPEGYWPETDTPPNDKAWESSVDAFRKDFKTMQRMIRDTKRNLYARIEGGTGQTFLREVLVLSAHNSYHLGQLMFLKKMLLAGA